MKMIANDTLLISSVKSDNILAGEEFEVSDQFGKSLIDRGLARQAKKARAPANKKAAEPTNKEA